MSDLPEFIGAMNSTAAKAYFLSTYTDIENFRLMYPTEWQEVLQSDQWIVNKWVVCMEVQRRIDALEGDNLLRRLAHHVYTIWEAIQASTN